MQEFKPFVIYHTKCEVLANISISLTDYDADHRYKLVCKIQIKTYLIMRTNYEMMLWRITFWSHPDDKLSVDCCDQIWARNKKPRNWTDFKRPRPVWEQPPTHKNGDMIHETQRHYELQYRERNKVGYYFFLSSVNIACLLCSSIPPLWDSHPSTGIISSIDISPDVKKLWEDRKCMACIQQLNNREWFELKCTLMC